jgi:hypothetical protein
MVLITDDCESDLELVTGKGEFSTFQQLRCMMSEDLEMTAEGRTVSQDTLEF